MKWIIQTLSYKNCDLGKNVICLKNNLIISCLADARDSISVTGFGCDWRDQSVAADRWAAAEQQSYQLVVLRPPEELLALRIRNVSALSEQHKPDLSVIPGNVSICQNCCWTSPTACIQCGWQFTFRFPRFICEDEPFRGFLQLIFF